MYTETISNVVDEFMLSNNVPINSQDVKDAIASSLPKHYEFSVSQVMKLSNIFLGYLTHGDSIDLSEIKFNFGMMVQIAYAISN